MAPVWAAAVTLTACHPPAHSSDAASRSAAPAIDWNAALRDADPQTGKVVASRCTACHSLEPDGANGVGPPLWGIVGGKVGAARDFPYSVALRLFAIKSPTWTYEALSNYIAAPQETVPGTKMTFYGIKNDRDRIRLIAYLQTLRPSPAGEGAPPPDKP